jgi:hypothetical protein
MYGWCLWLYGMGRRVSLKRSADTRDLRIYAAIESLIISHTCGTPNSQSIEQRCSVPLGQAGLVSCAVSSSPPEGYQLNYNYIRTRIRSRGGRERPQWILIFLAAWSLAG